MEYVDFKMADSEIALTQPKFKLGITSIIQNVFQGDYTTKQKHCWKKKLIVFQGRGQGLPLRGKFHENN